MIGASSFPKLLIRPQNLSQSPVRSFWALQVMPCPSPHSSPPAPFQQIWWSFTQQYELPKSSSNNSNNSNNNNNNNNNAKTKQPNNQTTKQPNNQTTKQPNNQNKQTNQTNYQTSKLPNTQTKKQTKKKKERKKERKKTNETNETKKQNNKKKKKKKKKKGNDKTLYRNHRNAAAVSFSVAFINALCLQVLHLLPLSPPYWPHQKNQGCLEGQYPKQLRLLTRKTRQLGFSKTWSKIWTAGGVRPKLQGSSLNSNADVLKHTGNWQNKSRGASFWTETSTLVWMKSKKKLLRKKNLQ